MSEPIAYSYVRFSDPSQAAGDSLRRQTEATADWCQRNKIRLDTSLSLRDLGVSAFKGRHRTEDKHALAQFLKLVERGRIPKDSYLVIENLDRLSREDERTALRLWMDILDAGVNIVQLKPETVFRHDKSDMIDIMRAIIELARGHSESARKSERVGAAWEQRRKNVRNGNGVLTHKLPLWVEERAGRLVLIPERAATVRHIFELSAGGRGLHAIMTKLNKDGVKAFGPSGRWSISYLDLILRDRRALGECQPRRGSRGKGKADGEPIVDYFPRVVDDELWHRVRQGAEQRWRRPGKVTADVNVFQGLLKGALDGQSYIVGKEMGKGKPYRSLRSAGPRTSAGKANSFPLVTFERAIFSQLREIDPHEILNGDSGPDETIVLAGELTRVEAKIAEVEGALLEGEVAALARVLRRLEGEKASLAARLAEARQKAANPLSESWGEAQTLLEALDAVPDQEEARLRLRGALRRIVAEIRLLVVPRGSARLCAAQIWFTGGKRHRDYLILNQRTKANASGRMEGGWWARSLADVADPAQLDLRRREDAEALAEVLAEADLTKLESSDH